MSLPSTFSFSSPGDAARAAELRRVKALATLVLAGTLALFVTAKILLPMHPAFGFVAAFAEAATIGPQLYKDFLARDVLIRPLGNTIYLMPPYCSSDSELDAVYDAIDGVVT